MGNRTVLGRHPALSSRSAAASRDRGKESSAGVVPRVLPVAASTIVAPAGSDSSHRLTLASAGATAASEPRAHDVGPVEERGVINGFTCDGPRTGGDDDFAVGPLLIRATARMPAKRAVPSTVPTKAFDRRDLPAST